MDTVNEEVVTQSEEQSQDNQNIADLTASLRDAVALIETQKSQISGLDSAVSKLQKVVDAKSEEVEATKKEKLTDIEMLQLQMKELQEQSLSDRLEATKATNEKNALLKISELKLPESVLKTLDYTKTDTLDTQIEIQANIYNDMKEQLAKEFATNNGSTPPKAPASTTQKSWTDLTMEERNELWVNNNELAKQLMYK